MSQRRGTWRISRVQPENSQSMPSRRSCQRIPRQRQEALQVPCMSKCYQCLMHGGVISLAISFGSWRFMKNTSYSTGCAIITSFWHLIFWQGKLYASCTCNDNSKTLNHLLLGCRNSKDLWSVLLHNLKFMTFSIHGYELNTKKDTFLAFDILRSPSRFGASGRKGKIEYFRFETLAATEVAKMVGFLARRRV